jgi:hypothetical protein
VILTEEEYAAVKEGEARAWYARKLAEERQLPLYVSSARALKPSERKKSL